MLKTKGTLFTGRDLRRLLLPLIAELIFTALMGTADTVMVARVGDAAVSGVSLVDAVNNVMLMVFTATSTGGTIVCAQFLGARDREGANRAARQVLLSVAVISALCGLACMLLRRQILSLVFRDVEQSVMDAGLTYFLSSAVSGALTLPFYVFSAIAIIWLISPSPKDAHRRKWQEITILLKKLLDDNEYKMVRNETERIGRQ